MRLDFFLPLRAIRLQPETPRDEQQLAHLVGRLAADQVPHQYAEDILGARCLLVPVIQDLHPFIDLLHEGECNTSPPSPVDDRATGVPQLRVRNGSLSLQ